MEQTDLAKKIEVRASMLKISVAKKQPADVQIRVCADGPMAYTPISSFVEDSEILYGFLCYAKRSFDDEDMVWCFYTADETDIQETCRAMYANSKIADFQGTFSKLKDAIEREKKGDISVDRTIRSCIDALLLSAFIGCFTKFDGVDYNQVTREETGLDDFTYKMLIGLFKATQVLKRGYYLYMSTLSVTVCTEIIKLCYNTALYCLPSHLKEESDEIQSEAVCSLTQSMLRTIIEEYSKAVCRWMLVFYNENARDAALAEVNGAFKSERFSTNTCKLPKSVTSEEAIMIHRQSDKVS